MKLHNSPLFRFAAIGGLTALVGGVTIAANADTTSTPPPSISSSQPTSTTPNAPVAPLDSVAPAPVAPAPDARPTISAIPGGESDDPSESSSDQATDDSTDQASNDSTDQEADVSTDQAMATGDNAGSNSQSTPDQQSGESD